VTGTGSQPGPGRPIATVPPRSAQAIALAGAALVLAGGAAVLVGHVLDSSPGGPSAVSLTGVSFNAAVAFVLTGLALVLVARERAPRLVVILLVPVILLTVVSITQAITGRSLGVDQLLWRVPDDTASLTPGRVAPTSALGLLLAAIGILALATSRAANHRVLVGLLLGFTTAVLAFLDLLGHLLQVPRDSMFPNSPQLPVLAGIILAMLGMAVAALGLHRAGNRIALIRPALGAGVLVMLVGTILAHVLRGQERIQVIRTVQAVANGAEFAVDDAIRDMYGILQAAAASGGSPGVDGPTWARVAGALLARSGDWAAVEFRPVGSDTVWRAGVPGSPVAPRGLAWERPATGVRIRNALDAGGRWVMPMVVEVPVSRGGDTVGTVRLLWDAQSALDSLLSGGGMNGYAIDVRYGPGSIYHNPAAGTPPIAAWTETRHLARGTTTLDLVLWPTAARLAEVRTGLPIVTQGATCLIATLLALALHFLGATRRRAAELEEAQAALQESQARLREAERLESMGRFAGGVAHEFNNLLTSIRGYATLAREALPGGHPVSGDLAEVEAAADRASMLTGQLLAVGQRQLLHPRNVDLGVLVREAVTRARAGTPGTVEVSVQPPTAAITVFMDPRQFEEVLRHLIRNAVDAMPAGGAIRIASGVHTGPITAGIARPPRPAGRYPWVQVADTGDGLDQARIERLFEPFGSAPGRGGRPAGLGLPAVFGIIAQSGGAVGIRSVRGGGTTVRVYLPEAAADPEAAEPPVAVAPDSRRPVVLLVEDEDAIRRFAERVLVGAGYEVHAAGNGADALALLGRLDRPPSLVISDVVMPGMQGDELVARVREDAPGTPVLFISGFAADVLSSQGMALQGAAFLQKPFAVEELLAHAALLAPVTAAEGA